VSDTTLSMSSTADEIERFAVFSPCRRYRYALARTWDFDRKPALFVGLNPSTADETVDDPTIRRCIRFARDWDYGGVLMANLFAFRATDPDEMKRALDPVGERNDFWLGRLAGMAGVVVAAWGVHGAHRGRARAVIDSGALGAYSVLGLTKDGHPRHPLYMKASSVPLYPHEVA
jgi:hypothetical protein